MQIMWPKARMVIRGVKEANRKIFSKQTLLSIAVFITCFEVPNIIAKFITSENFLWWFPPYTVMFIGGAVWGAYEMRVQKRKLEKIQWQNKPGAEKL